MKTTRPTVMEMATPTRATAKRAAPSNRPTRSIRRRLMVAVLAAAVLGMIVGVVPSQQQRLSVDLWLAGTATILAATLVRDALSTTPGLGLPLRSVFRFDRFGQIDAARNRRLPLGYRSLQSSLLASAGSERAFLLRLQPRLIEMANHRLRVGHGIDAARDPEAAAVALGDVAWLIDPQTKGRCPTDEDIARFLDRLDGPGLPQNMERT